MISKTPIEYFFHFWNRVKAKAYTMLLSPSFFSMGKKCSIMPPFRFGNLSGIQFGSRITIHNYCWIQAYDDKKYQELPKLIIKDNVTIGSYSIISAVKRIVIEENVFTAPNVYISDHGHEFQDVSIPIVRQVFEK